MELTTKPIITSIKFSEEEKFFMKTLAKHINDTCKAYDCEFCPFTLVQDATRVKCGCVADGLTALAEK